MTKRIHKNIAVHERRDSFTVVIVRDDYKVTVKFPREGAKPTAQKVKR